MGSEHISDAELLLALDGATGAESAAQIQAHCARCSSCRERKAELQQTADGFVRDYRRAFAEVLPPREQSRAALRGRLARWPRSRVIWASAAALALLIGGGLLVRQLRDDSTPNVAWTPGVVTAATSVALCAAPDRSGSAPIAVPVAQAVFERYGIRDPRPRSYEVDYLIPLALGGAADIRNLWPQPYSTGVWSARVKDALEDRLLSLVCAGKLDLKTAQRDLARNWVAAYKKYFDTQQPLPDHFAFVKDSPWE